jgi:hypothetical protein
MTGFAEGIGLYGPLSSDLRQQIEGRNILYRLNVSMENLRFGRPAGSRVLDEHPGWPAVTAEMADEPRGVHPAVWTRSRGERSFPRPTPSDAAHDNQRRSWPRLFRRQQGAGDGLNATRPLSGPWPRLEVVR